jgi:hypothetical protein
MQDPNIKNFIINVLRIFGVIGIIFCGIALTVPWVGFGYLGYVFSFNAWGISSNIPTTTITVSTSDAFYINTMSTGGTEGIFTGICMILVFIFTLITLFIGIIGLKKIQFQGSKTFLIAGIFAIITIILCVIAVSQIKSAIQTTMTITTPINIGSLIGYSYGFILMIIALIFFFIIFGLQVYLLHSPTASGMHHPISQQPIPAQQPSTTPPSNQPKQQTQQPTKTKTYTPKFCPQCGGHLQPNVNFCPSCGNKL